MIRIAGDHSLSEQANQLASLEEAHQLKKISSSEYESKKVHFILFSLVDLSKLSIKYLLHLIQQREMLQQLSDYGYCLSPADKSFLENKTDSEILENMRAIDDGLN